jgi:hypothetical protein
MLREIDEDKSRLRGPSLERALTRESLTRLARSGYLDAQLLFVSHLHP